MKIPNKIEIPGTKVFLQTIRTFFNEGSTNFSKTFIEAFIIKAFQDGLLASENIFEIRFDENYYEYSGFFFDKGLVEVHFVQYFTNRVPKLHFLTTYKNHFRHPKFFEFNVETEIGPIIDSFRTFFMGRLFVLSLMSYPFTIELCQDSKTFFIFEAGKSIPIKADFFVPAGSGIIRIKKKYLNEEKDHKIIIPGGLDNMIPGFLDINCSMNSLLILKTPNGIIEEGF